MVHIHVMNGKLINILEKYAINAFYQLYPTGLKLGR